VVKAHKVMPKGFIDIPAEKIKGKVVCRLIDKSYHVVFDRKGREDRVFHLGYAELLHRRIESSKLKRVTAKSYQRWLSKMRARP